jgi:hypothetical protein
MIEPGCQNRRFIEELAKDLRCRAPTAASNRAFVPPISELVVICRDFYHTEMGAPQ